MPSNGPINVLGLVFVQTGYFQDPDFYTVLGGAVIISSAIYIALRERRLNRERARLAGQNPN